MRHNNYYFGTRPVAPKTPVVSPYRKFMVCCLKCGSFKLRVISESDDESGELKVFLFCPQCREREQMPVR